jgi:steroid delta-isomerase
MPSPGEIRDAVERYVKVLSAGDVDGIMGLYADDCRVEDPVGGDPQVGHDAVRSFYGAMAGKLDVELTGPVRVAGSEAAFPMLARVEMGGKHFEMDVIDVMQFREDGKVVGMRAFWNPAEMRPTS